MELFLNTRTVKELTKLRRHYELPNLNKKPKQEILNALLAYIKLNKINISSVTDVLVQDNNTKKTIELNNLTRDELRAEYKRLGLRGKLNQMSKRDLIERIKTFKPAEQVNQFEQMQAEARKLLDMGFSLKELKNALNNL